MTADTGNRTALASTKLGVFSLFFEVSNLLGVFSRTEVRPIGLKLEL
jgi:hypothetical protein